MSSASALAIAKPVKLYLRFPNRAALLGRQRLNRAPNFLTRVNDAMRTAPLVNGIETGELRCPRKMLSWQTWTIRSRDSTCAPSK